MKIQLGLWGALILWFCCCSKLFAAEPLPDHWQQDPAAVFTVSAPYLDMHTFAGRTYPIYHVIEMGEEFFIEKRRNDWFKVETLDGKIGWVARKQLDGGITQNGDTIDFLTQTWKDHTENPYQVGLLAGNFEGAIAYSPFVSYQFTDNIQGEIRYTQAFGNNANLKVATASILHKPFPEWRVSPFFRLGSGFIQTNPSTILVQTKDREDPIVSVGGGFMLQATSRLVLRVEYENHTIMTTRDVNEEVEEWKAGFGVLF